MSQFCKQDRDVSLQRRRAARLAFLPLFYLSSHGGSLNVGRLEILSQSQREKPSDTHTHSPTYSAWEENVRIYTHTHTDVCFFELTQVMRRWTYFNLQQSFLSLVKKLHILLADLGEEGLVLVLWAQSFSKQQAFLPPLSG